jgi:anti-sigma B factor antagonist
MTDPGVVVSRVGAAVVAALPTEMDLLNADEILKRLASLLGEQPGVLVLDMTQTTFCDSAGAATLIYAHKKAASAQISLRLAASKNVARSLSLLAVDRLTRIYSTVDAAIEDSAASPSPDSGRVRDSAPDPAGSATDGGAVSS